MTKQSMRIFRVTPPTHPHPTPTPFFFSFFSSDKTTFKQQLNSEKGDVEYLSAFGLAVLGAEFGIVSLPPPPPPHLHPPSPHHHHPPPQSPTGSRSPPVPLLRRQLGVKEVNQPNQSVLPLPAQLHCSPWGVYFKRQTAKKNGANSSTQNH